MKRVAIYNPYLETKGGGEKVCLAIAEFLSQNSNTEVTLLTHSDVDINKISGYFKLNLESVRISVIDSSSIILKISHKLRLPNMLKNMIHDVKTYRSIKNGGYDIFINNCYQSNLPNPCQTGIYMCMFPQKINTSDHSNDRLLKSLLRSIVMYLYRIFTHPKYKYFIDTYSSITANSEFTKKYVKKYWNRSSSIIYPICDDMFTKNTTKEKIVLHVGRFFSNIGNSHHKRQDFLVSTFKDMKELHYDGWELHMAGSVAEDVDSLRYILSLLKESEGYPIFFHFNSTYEKLRELYNKSSIYWHATGYESDEARYPEKQEHFGITTVEAMSAGVVPIVINSAGQKEIVINEFNGLLWDNKEELISSTVNLSRNSVLLTELSKEAIQSSKRFGKESFSSQIEDIFSKYIMKDS